MPGALRSRLWIKVGEDAEVGRIAVAG